MTKENDSTDLATNVLTLTMAGQQVMLDTLRAEIVALQAMIPGLTHLNTETKPAAGATVSDDAAFDNMPV
jgi:hypothetical protein